MTPKQAPRLIIQNTPFHLLFLLKYTLMPFKNISLKSLTKLPKVCYNILIYQIYPNP